MIASTIASLGASATSISRFRTNRSLSIGLEVHRVVHDDLDRAVLLGERHHDVFAGERLGDELDDRGGDLDLAELDEVHAVLLGLGLHDVVGVGVAELDERLLERDVAHPLGFLELVGADDPALDQDLGPVAGLLRHGDAAPVETSPTRRGRASRVVAANAPAGERISASIRAVERYRGERTIRKRKKCACRRTRSSIESTGEMMRWMTGSMHSTLPQPGRIGKQPGRESSRESIDGRRTDLRTRNDADGRAGEEARRRPSADLDSSGSKTDPAQRSRLIVWPSARAAWAAARRAMGTRKGEQET